MKRLITRALFLLLSLAATTGSSYAQEKHDPTIYSRNDGWWIQLANQHVHSLDSSHPRIKAETIEQIARIASVYQERVNFDAAVPKLLDIYAFDTNKGNRMRALMALKAIGNENGIQRLQDLVKFEKSKNIRDETLAVLEDFEFTDETN